MSGHYVMSMFECKIHCCSRFRCFFFFLFIISHRTCSLFLISRHLIGLYFSARLMSVVNSSWLKGSSALTALTFCCLITNLFSTSLCDLLQPPGSLVPVQHRFSIAMTHKRDGYPALASQPFCMSLIPRPLPAPAGSSNVWWASMYRDGGRKRREGGLRVWKEGLEESFCLVLSMSKNFLSNLKIITSSVENGGYFI